MANRKRSKKRNKPIKHTDDHVRPRSRGAQEKYKGNIISSKHYYHTARHTIFGNDRLSEILGKLINHWETVCPYEEEKEPHTDSTQARFINRKKAWRTMFGYRATQKACIKRIVEVYCKASDADKQHMKKSLHMGVVVGVLNSREYDELVAKHLT